MVEKTIVVVEGGIVAAVYSTVFADSHNLEILDIDVARCESLESKLAIEARIDDIENASEYQNLMCAKAQTLAARGNTVSMNPNKIQSARQCLIDNGIDIDEVDTKVSLAPTTQMGHAHPLGALSVTFMRA